MARVYDRRITFRVDEKGRKALIRQAREEHLPFSTWARKVVLDYIKEKRG